MIEELRLSRYEKEELEDQQTLLRIAELEQTEPEGDEIQRLPGSLAEFETKLGRDYAKQ